MSCEQADTARIAQTETNETPRDSGTYVLGLVLGNVRPCAQISPSFLVVE